MNTYCFVVLLESHTLVFSLEAWQNTSKTFPVEPFRNMSRAHNEAKLLFFCGEIKDEFSGIKKNFRNMYFIFSRKACAMLMR